MNEIDTLQNEHQGMHFKLSPVGETPTGASAVGSEDTAHIKQSNATILKCTHTRDNAYRLFIHTLYNSITYIYRGELTRICL